MLLILSQGPRFPWHLLRHNPSSTSLSRLTARKQSETTHLKPHPFTEIADKFCGSNELGQQMPACLPPMIRFGITHPITTQVPVSVIASFCVEAEGFTK